MDSPFGTPPGRSRTRSRFESPSPSLRNSKVSRTPTTPTALGTPSFPASSYDSPPSGVAGVAGVAGFGSASGNQTFSAVPVVSVPHGFFMSKYDSSTFPEWWESFAIKITNLINLLNYDSKVKEYEYVIGGSAAVALYLYHYNPELLHEIDMPNDCDFYVVPSEFTQLLTLRHIPGKQIGNYQLNDRQLDTKSGTYTITIPNDNLFEKMDVVDIVKNFKYSVMGTGDLSFKIMPIEELHETYTSNRRNNKTMHNKTQNNKTMHNKEKHNKTKKTNMNNKKANHKSKNNKKINSLRKVLMSKPVLLTIQSFQGKHSDSRRHSRFPTMGKLFSEEE